MYEKFVENERKLCGHAHIRGKSRLLERIYTYKRTYIHRIHTLNINITYYKQIESKFYTEK